MAKKKADGMRIVELLAENVKRLKAVFIKPDGNVIVIGGKNAQGKSSVLDSIAYAFGGASLCPPEPIRKGSKKASVKITLDDLVIERTFTPGNSRLVVKRKNGDIVSSPQTILDTLTNKFTFDPLAFARMLAKEQMATLKELVNLDFADADEKRAGFYEQRRDFNRDAKAVQARIDALPELEDPPKEQIKVSSLLAELDTATVKNQANQYVRDQLVSVIQDATEAEEAMNAATIALQEARERAKQLTKTAENLKDVELGPIREKIDNAAVHNDTYLKDLQRRELVQEAADLQFSAEQLTKSMDEIDEWKRKSIEDAKFPIKGLAFGEGEVTYQKLPLSQASDAERIRISAAIGLAMHPKLRVLLIRSGEKLDADGRRELAEWATANDAQLWIEDCRAEDTGEATVIIEDGTIKDGGTALDLL